MGKTKLEYLYIGMVTTGGLQVGASQKNRCLKFYITLQTDSLRTGCILMVLRPV
jgi:hypothetical protein